MTRHKQNPTDLARRSIAYVQMAAELTPLMTAWECFISETLADPDQRARLCADVDQGEARHAAHIREFCRLMDTHAPDYPPAAEVQFMTSADYRCLLSWIDDRYPMTDAESAAIYEIGVKYGYYD